MNEVQKILTRLIKEHDDEIEDKQKELIALEIKLGKFLSDKDIRLTTLQEIKETENKIKILRKGSKLYKNRLETELCHDSPEYT